MTCIAIIDGKKIAEENLKYYYIENTMIKEIMETVNRRVNSDNIIASEPNIPTFQRAI